MLLSINDLIAVFDRIRELSRNQTCHLANLYNQALPDMHSCTIIISISVFLVLVLLIIGSKIFSGFLFALLVGRFWKPAVLLSLSYHWPWMSQCGRSRNLYKPLNNFNIFKQF